MVKKKRCLGFRDLENNFLEWKRNDTVFQFNFKKINLYHQLWIICSYKLVGIMSVFIKNWNNADS